MIKPCKFNELAWSLQQCNIILVVDASKQHVHDDAMNLRCMELNESTAASFVDAVKFFAVLERELEEEALWETGEEKVLQ
jgi:hypothetical protein